MMNDITFTDSHFEPEKRGYLMLQELYSCLPWEIGIGDL